MELLKDMINLAVAAVARSDRFRFGCSIDDGEKARHARYSKAFLLGSRLHYYRYSMSLAVRKQQQRQLLEFESDGR
jgi:hypothetical protein